MISKPKQEALIRRQKIEESLTNLNSNIRKLSEESDLYTYQTDVGLAVIRKF